MKIKKCASISDSIINEYLFSLSGDNINEIVSTSVTPSLSLEIDVSSDDNVYLEIPIQNVLNNISIIEHNKNSENKLSQIFIIVDESIDIMEYDNINKIKLYISKCFIVNF